jgi:hypothetical protein
VQRDLCAVLTSTLQRTLELQCRWNDAIVLRKIQNREHNAETVQLSDLQKCSNKEARRHVHPVFCMPAAMPFIVMILH